MTTIISVIIPVFNGEKTIKETVNSVLNQTFDEFELIIINANSTDSTLEIISQIQDPRIKIFSYPQANVAVNRNRGFHHSIGEFITFIDADDLWTPDKLEAQYKALIEKPQAAVAYSWTKCIDENGKSLSITWPRVQWTGDVYEKFLLFDFIGSGSNAMIRRNALEVTGLFNESLSNAQDSDMWIRLAASYDFIVVPQPQILYRISPISMSSDFVGFEKSALQIITRAYNHPKAASFQHLKHHSIANLYKYLSYKSLNVPPGKQKTLQVLKVLIKSITTDLKLIKKPIIYKAFLKLLAMTLLPPEWAKSLFNKFPKFANTSTFLGYGKTP
ncbi:glycosyltransferase [Trichormus variabilis]|uniref:Glycosyl transferase n=1 Tax=Trichormus variabilis SAG 1403-4b TaxID=447716 RepID=A0A433UZ77_ANAVA|nr:glycosyltransferase [Trichormus variabilis]MBD2625838.1 glycosyltransferase [Trichormus variabilis FACHB-164]RUS99126.1 glycosyl transferase [Trichormus variabilis SAG 1403-4b]